MKNEKALSIVESLLDHCKREYWEFYEAFDILSPKCVKADVKRKQINKHYGFRSDELGVFSSDGKYLFYDEQLVEKLYKRTQLKLLSHHLMHVILHLLLDDPENYRQITKKDLYSAYADIRVEEILLSMDPCKGSGMGEMFFSVADSWKMKVMEIKESIPTLPDSYFELTKNKVIMRKILREKDAFEYCDHSFWDVKTNASAGTGKVWDDIRKNILNTDKLSGKAKLTDNNKSPGEEGEKELYDAILDIAKDHGEKAKKDLTYGSSTGANQTEGKATKENENSYKDVIREFLREREVSIEDPETIDRNLYEYGFEMYDNVALIEPQEDTEKPCIDTIAIAIDTSGSCMGGLVNSFLREVSNLLRDVSYYRLGGKIILYQCDCEIQKRDIVESPEDMEKEIEETQIFGCGGTSFIPVFEDLKKYEEENEIKIDALFYLTDGMGSYPQEIPSYRTFFLMSKNMLLYENNIVPDWVERLWVDTDDKTEEEA
nr:VWA-like domain-containing protein [Lachnospiraceae bacterium]